MVRGPRTYDNDGFVRVSFNVEGLDRDELWFDLDPSFGEFTDDSCDAAVASLVLAAMAAGRPLLVDGPVSERLVWNLHNTVIPVVLRQLPFLRPVRIETWERRRGRRTAAGAIMTPLSCGVDSFAAIADHYLAEGLSERERVTHLLFSHIGHHGYGDEAGLRAERRFLLAQSAAAELGLPIGRVDSNTPEFYPEEHNSPFNWLATISVRMAAVPLLLQKGVKRFLVASSGSWGSVRVHETHNMSEAEPILLSAMSTDQVEISSVGWDYSRLDKTQRIAGLPVVQRHLDVCVMEGGVNCTRCEKCLRTLLGLDVLGHLEEFRGRFDLNAYKKHRSDSIARALAETQRPALIKIRQFMEDTGFPIPLSARLRAGLLKAWRTVPQGIRAKVRRIPGPPPPPHISFR